MVQYLHFRMLKIPLIYLSTYLSIYLSYLSIYLSNLLSIYLSIYPSIHLSIYLSIIIYLSFFISFFLSCFLSIFLSNHLSICLPCQKYVLHEYTFRFHCRSVCESSHLSLQRACGLGMYSAYTQSVMLAARVSHTHTHVSGLGPLLADKVLFQ